MRGDSGGKLGPGAQLGCFLRQIRVKERIERCVPGQMRGRDQARRGSFPGQTRPSVCFKEGEAVLVKLKRIREAGIKASVYYRFEGKLKYGIRT